MNDLNSERQRDHNLKYRMRMNCLLTSLSASARVDANGFVLCSECYAQEVKKLFKITVVFVSP